MGDERTYENVVCLRAVESLDGMTADWSHLPYELLARVSNEIINKVKGINRVVYRSEEHTSELQSLMRISYAVFCLTKKKKLKSDTTDKYIYSNRENLNKIETSQ